VLPLAISGTQRCVAFEHMGDHLASRGVLNCSFIPLRGVLAGSTPRLALGPSGEMAISLAGSSAAPPAEAIYSFLSGPHTTLASGVRASGGEVAEGLVLWLAARESGMCSLWAGAAPGPAEAVPELFGSPGKWRVSLGLVDWTGIALLGWARGGPPDESGRDELLVRLFGSGPALGEQLVRRLGEWQSAGRPTDASLRMRAYPREQPLPETTGAVVEQRWTRFVLDWLS
jgi:protein-L-isoaspartate(D-aspartate) O-methyltransferase